MLARSRSILDRRLLAGIELVDAATAERITAPMKISSSELGLVQNRSGFYAINAIHPKTAPQRQLAEHLDAFDAPPSGLVEGSVPFSLEIEDPKGRYLPRKKAVNLPRGDAASLPQVVEMFPSPSAPIGQNWSGVRASLKVEAPGGELPLAGARLNLLRASDNQILGSGISDTRGEVLAVAVGIPIIDFTTVSAPSSTPAPQPAPVGTKKVPTKLVIETAPDRPWPTDPDVFESNGQSWVPVSGALPTLELETGHIVSDGLSLLLKPQA